MSWMNSDGLYVKFSKEEADAAVGGSYNVLGATKMIEVDVDYTDLAASYAIIGSVANPGAFGVVVPKGAIVEKIELSITEAFTVSAGTADTAVFSFGLKKASDRSTELDHDEYTTTSFTGAQLSLEVVGNVVTVDPESTGAGNGYGVATAENGILVAANTRQATDTLNAGALKLRLFYR